MADSTKLYNILTGLVENDTQLWSKLSGRIPAIDTIGEKRSQSDNPIFSTSDKVWPVLESISGEITDTVKPDIRTLSSALNGYTGPNAVSAMFANTLEELAGQSSKIDDLSGYLSGYWEEAKISGSIANLATRVSNLESSGSDTPIANVTIEAAANDPGIVLDYNESANKYTIGTKLILSSELDSLLDSVSALQRQIIGS